MSNKELIHSDFETLHREREWRISTRVEFRPGREQYKCKARLLRSRNGRILDGRRDRKHKSTGVTSDKNEIDSILEDCIESCKDKLDTIEDATDIQVDVDITDDP
jgi:hypothetical protein